MNDEGPRILVVDDELAIRRYLKTILEASRYSVFEASDGLEALGAILTFRPDLIILDLALPDMDGVEITRKLREWSHTPIIILSVRDQDQVKIEALDSGADDYFNQAVQLRRAAGTHPDGTQARNTARG